MPTVDSDTPDVTFSYTRLGRQDDITDAVGTRTFNYSEGAGGKLHLLNEAINPTSGGLYSKTITRDYQSNTAEGELAGRDGGFHIGTEYGVTYLYDNAGTGGQLTGTGRFKRITGLAGSGLPAYGVEYGRLADSDLVEYARYKTDSTTTLISTQRDYESNRDLIEWVENKVGGTVVSRYDYNKPGGELDELGRRTSVVYTGTAFSQNHLFKWGYNPKSELVSSRSYEGDNPGDLDDEITPERRLYNYDQIGNRNDSTEGASTVSYYCPTDLNQYKYVGTTSPDCQTVTATHQYDDDGNLTQDGTFNYTWDAENRLIWVVPVSPSTEPPSNKKVKFVYDYRGRRVRKDVFYYAGGWPADDDPNERWHFVYDGWNVVMVLDGLPGHNNAVTRKYTWGLDLSGTIHGAGGIGGLLAVDETQGTYQGTYWFFYDANGNVGQLVKTIKDGNGNITGVESTLAAHYEYDPYGNVINNISSYAYATTNPIRFSTKWFDPETGLGYWGIRYYDPKRGRWISRDPIGEAGGLNLYAYTLNAPTQRSDPLGFQSVELFNQVVEGMKLRIEFQPGYGMHLHLTDPRSGTTGYYRWMFDRTVGRARFVQTSGPTQQNALSRLLGCAQKGKIRTAITRGRTLQGGFVSPSALVSIVGWQIIIAESAYVIEGSLELRALSQANFDMELHNQNKATLRHIARLKGERMAAQMLGTFDFSCCFRPVSAPAHCTENFTWGLVNLISFLSLDAYDQSVGLSQGSTTISVEKAMENLIVNLHSCVAKDGCGF